MEERTVAILVDGERRDRRLLVSTKPPWVMKLMSDSGPDEEYSCEASDLFECLLQLRANHLEPIGATIICNGSRLDVYPSTMSRQVSGGRKAYATRMGEQAENSDLLDILDPPVDCRFVVTVEKQQAFHAGWRASLG